MKQVQNRNPGIIGNMKIMELNLGEIREESQGTRTFFFDAPEGFIWNAGDNIHLGLDGFIGSDGPNKALVRHLSIMTLPREGQLGFTTRIPGSKSEFKQKLAEAESGARMFVFKPKSELPLVRDNRPVVLASMGVGIATVRPIVLAFLEDPEGIPQMMNLNVDRGGTHVFRKELEPLAGN